MKLRRPFSSPQSIHTPTNTQSKMFIAYLCCLSQKCNEIFPSFVPEKDYLLRQKQQRRKAWLYSYIFLLCEQLKKQYIERFCLFFSSTVLLALPLWCVIPTHLLKQTHNVLHILCVWNEGLCWATRMQSTQHIYPMLPGEDKWYKWVFWSRDLISSLVINCTELLPTV